LELFMGILGQEGRQIRQEKVDFRKVEGQQEIKEKKKGWGRKIPTIGTKVASHDFAAGTCL